MRILVNAQDILQSILSEYNHLSPDLPLTVFESRCRNIHIQMLKYKNAYAP